MALGATAAAGTAAALAAVAAAAAAVMQLPAATPKCSLRPPTAPGPALPLWRQPDPAAVGLGRGPHGLRAHHHLTIWPSRPSTTRRPRTESPPIRPPRQPRATAQAPNRPVPDRGRTRQRRPSQSPTGRLR